MSRRPVAEILTIAEFCERIGIDRPRFWEMVSEGLVPIPARILPHEGLRLRFYDHSGER